MSKPRYREITNLVCRYMAKESILDFTRKPFSLIRVFDKSITEYKTCIDGKVVVIPIRWAIFELCSGERVDTIAIQSFTRTLVLGKRVLVLKSVKMNVVECSNPFTNRMSYVYLFSARFGSIPEHPVFSCKVFDMVNS